MKFRPVLALSVLLGTTSLAAPPTLRDPAEQKAWNKIAAHFTGKPSLTNDGESTREISVSGLRARTTGGGVASLVVEKVSGRVIEVKSSAASFGDDDLAQFAAFPQLRALTLWYNSGFSGSGLSALTPLRQLERVTLSSGSLTDSGLTELSKIPTLRFLSAFHTKVSDAGIAVLKGHPSLETITLGPSFAPLITDQALVALAGCPALQELNITETYLTWEGGLKHLAARKTPLQRLNFGTCIIEPVDMSKLEQALPDAKIVWKGFGSAAEVLKKAWLRNAAESWIPAAVLERVRAAAPASAEVPAE